MPVRRSSRVSSMACNRRVKPPIHAATRPRSSRPASLDIGQAQSGDAVITMYRHPRASGPWATSRGTGRLGSRDMTFQSAAPSLTNLVGPDRQRPYSLTTYQAAPEDREIESIETCFGVASR